MDGTIRNRMGFGRRLRPATLEFALQVFPRLIVGLRSGSLIVSNPSAAGGPEYVCVVDPRDRYFRYLIVKSDFEACRQMALRLPVDTFHGAIPDRAIDAARSMVEVEFAGRGVPR
jgi:hypothetical protein